MKTRQAGAERTVMENEKRGHGYNEGNLAKRHCFESAESIDDQRRRNTTRNGKYESESTAARRWKNDALTLAAFRNMNGGGTQHQRR